MKRRSMKMGRRTVPCLCRVAIPVKWPLADIPGSAAHSKNGAPPATRCPANDGCRRLARSPHLYPHAGGRATGGWRRNWPPGIARVKSAKFDSASGPAGARAPERAGPCAPAPSSLFGGFTSAGGDGRPTRHANTPHCRYGAGTQSVRDLPTALLRALRVLSQY